MKTQALFLLHFNKSIRCMLFASMFILPMAGCGNSLQTKVTGKWVIDDGDQLFDMMGGGDSASEKKPKFELEFQSGGVFRSTVTSSGFSQTKQGRWFFVEGAADICKLKVSINSDNPEIKPDIVLTEIKIIDEKTIELIPPNMDVIKQKMTFRKSK